MLARQHLANHPPTSPVVPRSLLSSQLRISA